MTHPIIQRELIGTLRTKRALALLVGATVVFALLVISRWPSNATVELSGAGPGSVSAVCLRSAAVLLLLVPAFPATSIVREKKQGTLTLLLCSPMSSWSVFYGKALGMLTSSPCCLAMSIPAATAAYAMGGISVQSQLLPLYGILLLVLLQYTTLALMISSLVEFDGGGPADHVCSSCSAWPWGRWGRISFCRASRGCIRKLAEPLRCVSPIPVMMELAGHGDVGIVRAGGDAPRPATRFVLFATGSTVVFALLTIVQLNSFLLDRPRPQGIITNERSLAQRLLRRMVFLVDPHRRKKGIRWFMNPVMVKEFRTRRFGRTHWLLRLVCVAALVVAVAHVCGDDRHDRLGRADDRRDHGRAPSGADRRHHTQPGGQPDQCRAGERRVGPADDDTPVGRLDPDRQARQCAADARAGPVCHACRDTS